MLVLTMRPGSKLFITIDGKIVEVMLTKATKSQCWLGIKADRDIPIYRQELLNDDTDGDEYVERHEGR